jgi:hypothetical protein
MSFRIEPDGVYLEEELRQWGLFSEADLKKARQAGELRFKEVRKGKRVYLGRWLLRWLYGPRKAK